MSQFEKLMAELAQAGADQEVLTKALPADDGKDDANIQAAAAEGGSDGDGDEDDGAAGGAAADKPMAKSFQLTLEDGTVVEAQDGAEMVKALSDRVAVVEGSNEQLTKALESAAGVIKGFTPLIKSLQDQITKLSGEGRGRKAVVSMVEKPKGTEMVKSQADGMSHDVFFAKALEGQKAGRISGQDIAIAEAYLNKGQAIPEHIVARVMA